MSPKKLALPLSLERSVAAAQAQRIRLADRYTAAARKWAAEHKSPITCLPGCASCCHHPILVSILEGVSVYRYLLDTGRWTAALQAALKEASDRQYGVNYTIWLLSLTPCSFLGSDKHCTIYEQRPFICRIYHATSDPYYCHPHRLGPSTQLVPRDAALKLYQDTETRFLKRHGLQFFGMPLGTAVLLADRLTRGSMSIENVDAEVLKEYLEKG